MIDQLKKVIQAANPEIMELGFGCQVKMLLGDSYGEIAYVEYVCGKCTKHKKHKSCNEDCDIEDAVSVVTHPDEEPTEWVLLQNGKDFEILGRPIRLADVLLALHKKYKSTNYHDLYINSVIQAVVLWPSKEISRPWDLTKNSLDDQSPECIEFLAKLLL